MKNLIASATILMALGLLAGCGEEPVGDLDRIDAAPVGRVSEEALESPDRDIQPLIEDSETGEANRRASEQETTGGGY